VGVSLPLVEDHCSVPPKMSSRTLGWRPLVSTVIAAPVLLMKRETTSLDPANNDRASPSPHFPTRPRFHQQRVSFRRSRGGYRSSFRKDLACWSTPWLCFLLDKKLVMTTAVHGEDSCFHLQYGARNLCEGAFTIQFYERTPANLVKHCRFHIYSCIC
jgi:hypothetical protein